MRLRAIKGRTSVGFGGNGSITGNTGTGGGGGGTPGGGGGGDPGGGGGSPGGTAAGILQVYQDGINPGVIVFHFDQPVFNNGAVPDGSVLVNGVPLTSIVYTSDGYGYFNFGGG